MCLCAKLNTSSPDTASHTRAEKSADAVATCVAGVFRHALHTAPLWPSNVPIQSPVSPFRSIGLPSAVEPGTPPGHARQQARRAQDDGTGRHMGLEQRDRQLGWRPGRLGAPARGRSQGATPLLADTRNTPSSVCWLYAISTMGRLCPWHTSGLTAAMARGKGHTHSQLNAQGWRAGAGGGAHQKACFSAQLPAVQGHGTKRRGRGASAVSAEAGRWAGSVCAVRGTASRVSAPLSSVARRWAHACRVLRVPAPLSGSGACALFESPTHTMSRFGNGTFAKPENALKRAVRAPQSPPPGRAAVDPGAAGWLTA